MATTPTPRFSLERLESSQASAEIPLNENANHIDALMHLSVKNTSTTAPPGSPANGDCYLVAAGATGAWAGQDGKIAIYNSGWTFVATRLGVIMFDESADTLYVKKAGGFTAV